MTPRYITRLIAVAVVGAMAIATAGCAGVPGAKGPAPTSVATASPEPDSTTHAPSTAAPSTTDAEFGSFTGDELAKICVDATVSTFNSDVRFDFGHTRVEHRTVDPEWLVIVPARTGGIDGRALCTIGGTPSAPVLELSSGSISELPEEQIQRLIRGENEGGDR
ncbi:hypothetical protein ACTU6U_00010 [Microbacterium sp. A196]|uniref:hypothetical protein n=1 Tax=Microbacterium sp. A196 TaxID=3457320 RepID=UPI003FD1FB19